MTVKIKFDSHGEVKKITGNIGQTRANRGALELWKGNVEPTTGYKLRQKDGKKHAVEGFHSMNLKVFASGDSYNDLSMIKEADGGMLFCPPQRIVDENPTIGVAHNYDELLAGIRKTIAQCR